MEEIDEEDSISDHGEGSMDEASTSDHGEGSMDVGSRNDRAIR